MHHSSRDMNFMIHLYLQMEHIDLNLPSQVEEILNLENGVSVGLAQDSMPMDSDLKSTSASARLSETAEVSCLNLFSISITAA